MDTFNEQVFEMMTRCKGRAASSQDVKETEILDGLLVSRPMKASEEPKIIDLQEYTRHDGGAARGGKIGSVNGNSSVNKVKVIADFPNSGGTG